MKNKKKVLLLFIVSILIIIPLSACGKDKKETLVLGTSADYPPFEFMDSKKEIMGMDIMIAKEIAKDKNMELKIENMDFNSLITALQSGKVDMVLSGMNPDKERRKSVDFSKIYHQSNHYVVINSDDKDSIKDKDDLKGKKIGVQMSTTQEKITRKEYPDAELTALPSIADIMMMLKSGKIDAAITEDAVGRSYVDSSNSELILPGIVFEDKEGGIAVAVKKGNKDLLKSVDKTLDKLSKDDKVKDFYEESIKLSKDASTDDTK